MGIGLWGQERPVGISASNPCANAPKQGFTLQKIMNLPQQPYQELGAIPTAIAADSYM
jgi:hypothetical protein